MIRQTSLAVALVATLGCAGSPSETALERPAPAATLTSFTGNWRSVTPSMEFVRLSVHSLSREMGALGARLTFSGVAWDGSGTIDGDSLVASMTMLGSALPNGTLVARASDERTLRVQLQRAGGEALDLTFVRDD